MSGHPERLPALDALRAVGALMVVAVHVGAFSGRSDHGFLGGVIARLDTGVAIFFVLSGFLLFRPFALAHATGGEAPSVRRYLSRRALRILPAYWLMVVVVLLALPANDGVAAREWAENLTLTFIYQPSFNSGLIQAWSLCTEVAFYLFMPLIAWVALGRRWNAGRTLAVLVAVGVGATGGWLAMDAAGVPPATRLGSETWLPGYASWFCGGMALAAIHAALRTGTAPPAWRILDRIGAAPLVCSIVAVGLLCVAATSLAGPRGLGPITVTQHGTKLALEGTIAALVLIPMAFGGEHAIKRAAGSAVLRWLGAVSYGLFLWHLFVLEVIYLVTDRPHGNGGFPEIYVLTVAISLLLAAASWYLLERPILNVRWTRRRGRQPATATEAPAVAQ